MRTIFSFSLALLCLLNAPGRLLAAAEESGFTTLFDGKTLNGWKLVGKHGDGYGVKDGVLFCARGGGGNLFTEQEYSDFIFRFEFKLEPGSNNGVGIRAPLEGDAAYLGMEIQVLDDTAPKYATLKPFQYHGSIYGVVASRQGFLKPVGEWNQQEITTQGRHVRVTLNGKIIVNADLNRVTDPEILKTHPGLFRERGHIGFLGHNDYVEFRNIRVKSIPPRAAENKPPFNFKALYNGQDLAGWKGLLAAPNDNPFNRAKLAPADLAAEQAKADERMRAHWKSENGVLVFDGKGDSLCTVRDDYGNFELLVDWKIMANGDSGIYLRGAPQVQIWDPANLGGNAKGEGSGGLFNNQKNPSGPLKVADKPVGEWNTFRIVMVDEKVHVFLNGELVVKNTTLENYWDYTKPIFPTGQIELQNHGNKLYFKNIYIRELPGK